MHGKGAWFEPVLWHKCHKSIHAPRVGEPCPTCRALCPDSVNIIRVVEPMERDRVLWQCGPPQGDTMTIDDIDALTWGPFENGCLIGVSSLDIDYGCHTDLCLPDDAHSDNDDKYWFTTQGETP